MTDARTLELWSSLERFYRRETQLLQDHRYRDWLALMGSELEYRVPVTTLTAGGLAVKDNELGYYDEDLRLLTARVEKLESKQSWVEQPPSRLRYFIQLNEITVDENGHVHARSNVLLYQYRWNMEQHFTGGRDDILMPHEGGFRILKRTVILDRQSAGNQGLSVFF